MHWLPSFLTIFCSTSTKAFSYIYLINLFLRVEVKGCFYSCGVFKTFAGTLIIMGTLDQSIHQILQIIPHFLFIKCLNSSSGHTSLVSCVEGWISISISIPLSFDWICRVLLFFLPAQNLHKNHTILKMLFQVFSFNFWSFDILLQSHGKS